MGRGCVITAVLVRVEPEPRNVVAHLEALPRVGEEIDLAPDGSFYVHHIRHELVRFDDQAGAHGIFIILERERPA